MVHCVCCALLTEPTEGQPTVDEEIEVTEWSKYLAGVEERMKDGISLQLHSFSCNKLFCISKNSDKIELYTMFSDNRYWTAALEQFASQYSPIL